MCSDLDFELEDLPDGDTYIPIDIDGVVVEYITQEEVETASALEETKVASEAGAASKHCKVHYPVE